MERRFTVKEHQVAPVKGTSDKSQRQNVHKTFIVFT